MSASSHEIDFPGYIETVVTDLETFKKVLTKREAGDNVGILLRSIYKTEVQRGAVLSAPGTICALKSIEAQVYILTKEEGGRHTPIFPGYRPHTLLFLLVCYRFTNINYSEHTKIFSNVKI